MADTAKETVKVVRSSPIVPAPDQPTTLPDGSVVVSGPVPEGYDVPRPLSGPTIVKPGEVMFNGTAGGAFAAYGTNFGKPGTVTVGGIQVTVTSWRDIAVKGLLPFVVDPLAEVVITDRDGHVQKRPAIKHGEEVKHA